MTVQVRGFSFAMSGTIPVPAGTSAGDVLIAKVRSFFEPSVADSTPFDVPAGWTQLANALGGFQGSGTQPGSTFGYASFWRTATSAEPASYTFVAPRGEQTMGGMWAVSSSVGSVMNVLHSGTATSSPTPAYTTNVFHSVDEQSLMVYSFCGQGTAYASFSGFVNARTHHAEGTLHSDTPWSSGVIPDNAAQHKDIVLSLDSEPGPFGTGSRIATTTLPDLGTYGYANTYVRIVEVSPLPVAAGGWTNWIID